MDLLRERERSLPFSTFSRCHFPIVHNFFHSNAIKMDLVLWRARILERGTRVTVYGIPILFVYSVSLSSMRVEDVL